MHKNRKNKKMFAISEKVTLIHTTMACMEGLKYAAHCVKCTSFA